ncbi:hypothetical protein [Arthrobacter sp. M4]|uniref:hypothetical protein n=1 Tax=Arthrobacter sp. M4 TaxID=218160 RepID=UPI001CDC3619|nr:hypothetical protein [Arthrobacter sp. M4]MCA4134117.1 hypothetical protein [Arthrobacter sp. M4]
MAEQIPGEGINPEVASHLTESMETPQVPEPATLAMALGQPQGQKWPDGYGKNKHPRERSASHGRMGQAAAVNAVHRTGRPQMPHSS